MGVGFTSHSYKHNHGVFDGCTTACPSFGEYKKRTKKLKPSKKGEITFGNSAVQQIKLGLMDKDLDRVIKAAKKRRKMLRTSS